MEEITQRAASGELLTLDSDGYWRDSRMRVWMRNRHGVMKPVPVTVFRAVHGKTIRLQSDGRWLDEDGNEYGISEPNLSIDATVRLGVGAASLDPNHPLSPAATAHDFAYSSPAYQRSNPRSRADGLLDQQMRELSGNKFQRHIVRPVLSALARIFGGIFWENDRTRWK